MSESCWRRAPAHVIREKIAMRSAIEKPAAMPAGTLRAGALLLGLAAAFMLVVVTAGHSVAADRFAEALGIGPAG
jgi:hypothetical protein